MRFLGGAGYKFRQAWCAFRGLTVVMRPLRFAFDTSHFLSESPLFSPAIVFYSSVNINDHLLRPEHCVQGLVSKLCPYEAFTIGRDIGGKQDR